MLTQTTLWFKYSISDEGHPEMICIHPMGFWLKYEYDKEEKEVFLEVSVWAEEWQRAEGKNIPENRVKAYMAKNPNTFTIGSPDLIFMQYAVALASEAI